MVNPLTGPEGDGERIAFLCLTESHPVLLARASLVSLCSLAFDVEVGDLENPSTGRISIPPLILLVERRVDLRARLFERMEDLRPRLFERMEDLRERFADLRERLEDLRERIADLRERFTGRTLSFLTLLRFPLERTCYFTIL